MAPAILLGRKCDFLVQAFGILRLCWVPYLVIGNPSGMTMCYKCVCSPSVMQGYLVLFTSCLLLTCGGTMSRARLLMSYTSSTPRIAQPRTLRNLEPTAGHTESIVLVVRHGHCYTLLAL